MKTEQAIVMTARVSPSGGKGAIQEMHAWRSKDGEIGERGKGEKGVGRTRVAKTERVARIERAARSPRSRQKGGKGEKGGDDGVGGEDGLRCGCGVRKKELGAKLKQSLSARSRLPFWIYARNMPAAA